MKIDSSTKEAYIPDEFYRNIMDVMPICTVDIVVISLEEKKVLLFRRENEPLRRTYFTPGGRVHKQELLIEAAMRICKQEMGVILGEQDLTLCATVDEIHDNSCYGSSVTYHCVCSFFYCIYENIVQSITLDAQHSDFRWFRLDSDEVHPLIKKKFRIVERLLAEKK